jgi:hypothetical protein
MILLLQKFRGVRPYPNGSGHADDLSRIATTRGEAKIDGTADNGISDSSCLHGNGCASRSRIPTTMQKVSASLPDCLAFKVTVARHGCLKMPIHGGAQHAYTSLGLGTSSIATCGGSTSWLVGSTEVSAGPRCRHHSSSSFPAQDAL